MNNSRTCTDNTISQHKHRKQHLTSPYPRYPKEISHCQINNVYGWETRMRHCVVSRPSRGGTLRTLGTVFWGIITLVSTTVPVQSPLEKDPQTVSVCRFASLSCSWCCRSLGINCTLIHYSMWTIKRLKNASLHLLPFPGPLSPGAFQASHTKIKDCLK